MAEWMKKTEIDEKVFVCVWKNRQKLYFSHLLNRRQYLFGVGRTHGGSSLRLLTNFVEKKRFEKLHKLEAPSERELSPQGD